MNAMVDFVANFNLFMNKDQEQKQSVDTIENLNNQDHDLYNKEKPNFRKKPLNQIFNIKKQNPKKK